MAVLKVQILLVQKSDTKERNVPLIRVSFQAERHCILECSPGLGWVGLSWIFFNLTT